MFLKVTYVTFITSETKTLKKMKTLNLSKEVTAIVNQIASEIAKEIFEVPNMVVVSKEQIEAIKVNISLNVAKIAEVEVYEVVWFDLFNFHKAEVKENRFIIHHPMRTVRAKKEQIQQFNELTFERL